jgi:hypothetical protein
MEGPQRRGKRSKSIGFPDFTRLTGLGGTGCRCVERQYISGTAKRLFLTMRQPNYNHYSLG